MKTMNLFLLAFITSSAIADQSTAPGQIKKLGEPVLATVKKLEQNNLQEMVMRMSDGKLGRLLTNPNMQSLLGGNCKVQINPYGSVLYTLSIPGSAVKQIGVKTVPKVNISLKSRNIRRVQKIPMTPAPAQQTVRSTDEIDVALKELGATFKSEIADRQWPCGASPAESGQLFFADLKDQVEFYKDEESGAIECVSPHGKTMAIRSATSCSTETLPDVLPDDLCQYVLHIVRSEVEDELEIAVKPKVVPSTPADSGSTGPIVSRPAPQPKPQPKLVSKRPSRKPTFRPVTSETRRKIRLAKYVQEDPEIAGFLQSAKVPKADSFLSAEAKQLLEDDDETDADFANLSEEKQVELTRLALAVESIEGEPGFVEASPELKEVVEGIKPYADQVIGSNPDLEVSVYRFPGKNELSDALNKRVARLNEVTGTEYKTNLPCVTEPTPGSGSAPGGSDTIKPGRKIRKIVSKRNPTPVTLKNNNFLETARERRANLREN